MTPAFRRPGHRHSLSVVLTNHSSRSFCAAGFLLLPIRRLSYSRRLNSFIAGPGPSSMMRRAGSCHPIEHFIQHRQIRLAHRRQADNPCPAVSPCRLSGFRGQIESNSDAQPQPLLAAQSAGHAAGSVVARWRTALPDLERPQRQVQLVVNHEQVLAPGRLQTRRTRAATASAAQVHKRLRLGQDHCRALQCGRLR